MSLASRLQTPARRIGMMRMMMKITSATDSVPNTSFVSFLSTNDDLTSAAFINEKALRETQTLRAGCSKAGPIFSPRRRLPSRGRGTAKISSAGDGYYFYLQTQFDEDRCTQFRVITDPPTHPPTDRTDYNTLRRSKIGLI